MIGISTNHPFSQKAFADSLKLSYPLLSDENMAVTKSYKVVYGQTPGKIDYPHNKGKIAKRQDKLALKVQKVCIDHEVTPVGAAFPGACTGAANDAFDECVGQRAACTFCRAVNRADAIVPPAGCDAFDDGVTNATCAP